MGTEYSTAYCDHCDDNVKIERKTPNHLLHLVLSVITCGVWLLVWFCVSSEKSPWICSVCGKKLGGGSNGWGLAGALFSSNPKEVDGFRIDCPHCAEKIKAAAKVCKHCGREINPVRKKKTGRRRRG